MPAPLDILIIGAGPAGLTAGLYAIRTGRTVQVLEQIAPGGQAATTWQVDNYPGLPHINGAELMQKMEAQVREFDLPIAVELVDQLVPGAPFRVQTALREWQARSVILACGAQPRRLQVPGEDLYRGRGVSYCATCDGAFFRGLAVAVVGGGNTALEEAEFLTRFASKVYLVHRRTEFRADRILQDRVLRLPAIEVVTPFTPVSIEGDGQRVVGLKCRSDQLGERTLAVQGVFIFVGSDPSTGPFQKTLTCNEQGYIETTPDLATSVPGVFAAGDCRAGSWKQIVTAAGEGAAAAMQADHYLRSLA